MSSNNTIYLYYSTLYNKYEVKSNTLYLDSSLKNEDIHSFNDTYNEKINLKFLGEIKACSKINIEGSTIDYEKAYDSYSYFKKVFNGKNLFEYLIEIYNNENGI